MESKKSEEKNIIIGIDPDCKKSGVAVLFKNKKLFYTVGTRTFSEMMTLLDVFKDIAKVVIEGGWLNESNWHVKGHKLTASMAAAMGRSVGMNHQTGILLAEMCAAKEIPCEVIKPLAKGWSGPDRKITAEELEYFTGWSKHTNQDARDAALLAWSYANLPIKVKTWKGK